jgi:predicted MFS family arabinose efflux permease
VARKLLRKLQQQHLPPPDWVLQYSGTTQPSTLHPKQLLHLLKRLVMDPTVLPYMLLQWHTFGCMFLLLLQLTEVLLETTNLNPTKIGLCYFATGFCSMVGSLLGGWAADKAAAAELSAPTARVEWSSLTSLLLIPAGLLLVGWTEAAGWRDAAAIAATIVGGSLVCYAASFVLPGGYSYLSHKAGEFAAAVGSITAAVSGVLCSAVQTAMAAGMR